MLEWKRLKTQEQIIAARYQLDNHCHSEPCASDLKDDFENAHSHYVYATENEIAVALGYDLDNLDEFQQEEGALTHARDSCDSSILFPVIPEELGNDWVYAALPDEGSVVIVRDTVLKLG